MTLLLMTTLEVTAEAGRIGLGNISPKVRDLKNEDSHLHTVSDTGFVILEPFPTNEKGGITALTKHILGLISLTHD